MTSTISHISEKPWSEYTKADYTPEQWHRSCLIHQHTDAPTSKDQCKLPVRTPNGVVNRNGVHAAAAALAGARGGVQASSDEISSAKTALVRLYGQLGEDPPDSLTHSEEEFVAQTFVDVGEKFVAHYGIRGMKWGRRTKSSSSKAPETDDAPEHTRARQLHRTAQTQGTRKLTNKDLQDLTQRLNLEQQYSRLTTTDKGNKAVGIGSNWVRNRIKNVGNAVVDEVLKSHARQYALGKGLMAKAK
jgi:hypothetical protein